MPEGDTIHTLARALAPRVIDRTPVAVHLRHRGPVSLGPDARIIGVDAQGKNLLVRFSSDRVLMVHLGLRGSWRVYPWDRLPPDAERYASLVMRVGGEGHVCRNAKRAEVMTAAAAARHPALLRLGPDLLDPACDLDVVVRRARDAAIGGVAIGELLLDQSVAAGIGNVYKSEILFQLGVDPFAPAHSIPEPTMRAIYTLAREQLTANVRPGKRVTVARDERRVADPRMEPALFVYRRSGQPCLRCRTTIAMRRQGDDARSTYYCPRCQTVC